MLVEKPVWFLVVLLVTSAFAGGCQGRSQSLPFRLVPDPGTWGLASTEPAYLVVTDKNWRTYYPAPPAGADFQANFYLVASWGIRPNPGYRISIVGIQQSGARVGVKVKLEEPDPKKVYPQVLVHPVAVAGLKKTSLQQRGLLTFDFRGQKGEPLARVEAELQ